MKFVILTLTIFFGNTLSWGGYKINFEYSDLEYDENLFNMEVQMKRADDKTVVNVRAEQFEDIQDPIFIHVAHFEKVNNEYNHLINTSLNACNFMSRAKSHPIVRLVMKELLRSSNFPTSCPIKKARFKSYEEILILAMYYLIFQGIYYMKDFILNDDLLPPFLPLGNFMSIIRATRSIDDNEMALVRMIMYVNIDYPKEKKGLKFF
ncbi:CLUMA_CG021127, isoform A [Clunio marinus]|uniref:CLUMA_CG021127, isoform A n=1 Tax=Clunio marinus TaxID=568069 RepID=A0A1J1J727_9DIPT|nr:CLUMA_CG021127, isoform A [Clunio marinus]